MIPFWLEALAKSAPILLFVSVGVAIFGGYRFFSYMARRSAEREEEEKQRQEFLKKMSEKLPDVKLKK